MVKRWSPLYAVQPANDSYRTLRWEEQRPHPLPRQAKLFEDVVSRSATVDGTSETAPAPAIRLAAEVAGRYGMVSLEPLLKSCRAFAGEDNLNVAVLCRFKAGKSSFLNYLWFSKISTPGMEPCCEGEIFRGLSREHANSTDPTDRSVSFGPCGLALVGRDNLRVEKLTDTSLT